jgi:acetyl esterase/lipase
MKHARTLIGSLLACSLFASLGGCTGLTLAIANLPSKFGNYEIERDIVYSEQRELRLDVYRPAHVDGTNRALVVFFHGGGWTTGGKAQYQFVAEALLSQGYVVVVPEYRLYPAAKFPGFVEDAAEAVAWAHRHAIEQGADAARVFVMGHSAGAHIGAMVTFDERFLLALEGDSSWIRGFIGLAGPYDFLPFTEQYLEQVFAPADQYADTQPINFVDGSEPPALLLHGLDDTVVWPRNSERLAAKISAKGGQVTERYYEDMSHGGILGALSVYLRSRRTVLDDVSAFISHSRNRSVALTNSCVLPSSNAEWPASATTRKSASGQALCKAHAVCMGHTTS